LHVWMAPWQEKMSRAAQKSLAVMCPARSRSPDGLLALMESANRGLITRAGRDKAHGVSRAVLPQHCLNFLPDPQGQGSLRPILGVVRRKVAALRGGSVPSRR